MSFSDDNFITINTLSSVLCQFEACAKIRSQAVYEGRAKYRKEMEIPQGD